MDVARPGGTPAARLTRGHHPPRRRQGGRHPARRRRVRPRRHRGDVGPGPEGRPPHREGGPHRDHRLRARQRSRRRVGGPRPRKPPARRGRSGRTPPAGGLGTRCAGTAQRRPRCIAGRGTRHVASGPAGTRGTAPARRTPPTRVAPRRRWARGAPRPCLNGRTARSTRARRTRRLGPAPGPAGPVRAAASTTAGVDAPQCRARRAAPRAASRGRTALARWHPGRASRHRGAKRTRPSRGTCRGVPRPFAHLGRGAPAPHDPGGMEGPRRGGSQRRQGRSPARGPLRRGVRLHREPRRRRSRDDDHSARRATDRASRRCATVGWPASWRHWTPAGSPTPSGFRRALRSRRRACPPTWPSAWPKLRAAPCLRTWPRPNGRRFSTP